MVIDIAARANELTPVLGPRTKSKPGSASRGRSTLYNKVVIQRAADTTDASLTAYTAGVSDFAELIRSRLAQLDNELTLLRLRVDRAQAHARLLFLAGK